MSCMSVQSKTRPHTWEYISLPRKLKPSWNRRGKWWCWMLISYYDIHCRTWKWTVLFFIYLIKTYYFTKHTFQRICNGPIFISIICNNINNGNTIFTIFSNWTTIKWTPEFWIIIILILNNDSQKCWKRNRTSDYSIFVKLYPRRMSFQWRIFRKN